MKVPFSPPRIDEKNIEAVVEVLRSGWITTGPKTKEFEKRIADFCMVPDVLCVNSASAGLELVLHWFGVGAGDEVILPAYNRAGMCQSSENVLVAPFTDEPLPFHNPTS